MAKEPRIKVTQKIRDAQELSRRGWTSAEIMEAMKVSQPSLSRYLRGRASR